MARAPRGREQRLVSRCRVEFDRPSGPVEAETEDLSPHGVFIRTDSLLPVGEETELRLTLPDGTYLELPARVAHMLTPHAARALGRHPGMGFSLLGGDTGARLMLRAHIDSVRAEATNPGVSTTTQALIVEASAPLRARMQRCLEGAGFKIIAVASVQEALDTCTQWRPDVIVSAATFTNGVAGIDLAYALAEHSSLADVPLVMTGHEGDLARLEAFRAGIRDYIPQPFLDEELLIRVHRLVSPPAPVANPGLRGNILDIGLGTLLSLLEFERKSGILSLIRDNDSARLFVSEGRVLAVEGNANDAPKQRLMRLLDWQVGQFEFSPCAIGGRDEVKTTITQVLLEHAREQDEQNPDLTNKFRR